MRHWKPGLALLGVGVAAFALGALWQARGAGAQRFAVVAPEAAAKVRFYRHPMDPTITSPTPAKDSMGMDYLPVYDATAPGSYGMAASAVAPAGVALDGAMRQSLGVRTATVQRRALGAPLHATGQVVWDERRITHVHARVAGWVTQLHVHAVGDPVRAGQVLGMLDSRELDGAQREHLAALRSGETALIAASRARLGALGLARAQVRALERGGASSRAVPVRAPADGFITTLGMRHGMYVTPETELFALASLESVWVDAEVLERAASGVRAGDAAQIADPRQPGSHRAAHVDYVYPQLDPATRAQRVRLVVPNADAALRPGMWLEVTLTAPDGAPVLTVPREAVIRSGAGERVVLALPDGRFDVRTVRTGAAGGDAVEVLEGLAEGDTVVVSGQFLLDTEASTAAALDALRSADAPAPGASPATAGVPVAGSAHAPAPGSGSGSGSDSAAPAAVAPADAQTPGVVRAVDAAARVVTLEHPAIEAIGMPAMTMEFAVLPQVPLAGLKPGDRVLAQLRLTAQGYALTAIEPAP